jgi:predicted nuclease of predicted toxin-antitoxin system
MRFLADENIPSRAVYSLRKNGHDITSIFEEAPGLSDRDILELAEREGRVIITFDKDFGELAYNSALPASCGIILFRIPLRSADYISSIIVDVIKSRSDWPGNFAVVEPGRLRLRALKS